MKERQIVLRIVALVVFLSIAGVAAGWLWLSVSANSRGIQFALITVALSVVNLFVALPGVVYTRNPWRRLGQLAMAWAVTSICLYAADGWPSFTDWFHHPPSTVQIFAYATGFVAASDVLGGALIRIGDFALSLILDRRRVRITPHDTALEHAIELVEFIGEDGDLGGVFGARWITQRLELISRCLSTGLPTVLAMPATSARDVANKRFGQAAATIRDYEAWVALPQGDTGLELRGRLAELAMTLLTGHYHLLPTMGADEPSAMAASRSVRRYGVGLLVAIVPITIVVVWKFVGYSLVGYSLPDYFQQWLGGFALVWLIARILELFEPDYGATWDRVRSTFGPPRPPNPRDES
jgi:hypothetical protein